MSTSLLYHAFGIRGYVYQRSEYVGGEVHFTVEQPSDRLRCAVCRSRRVIRRGERTRRFRGLPIGNRAVWVVLRVPRLECKACGAVRQVEVSFAPGQHRYTKRFARYALDLARHMTIWDVAQHLGISWNLVKALVKEDLTRRFGRPRLKDLRLLAIDLSQAYISALQTHLPEATLVFDHFHVVKLMNDKLSNLRRNLQRQAEAEQKEVLKGARWLLLESPKRLDEARDEVQRLRAALELNAPLAAAYYLKEDLRQLWSQPDKESATTFLECWIERARATGLR